MIRAILVDDENAAINSLLTDLKWYCEDEVEVLGTANNLDDGLKLIEKHHPELVFLDIQIGNENGFMLLEKIQKTNPNIRVIFTTGHSDFVMDALRKEAFDYLLKPIDPDDLKAAVLRLKDHLQKTSPNQIPVPNAVEPSISLPMQDQIRVCRLRDIVRCESDRNYTRFHFTDRSSVLVSKNLGTFELQLIPSNFFRAHKSHLVNLAHLQSYIRQEGGYLVMRDGSHVPLARNSKTALLSILGL